MSYKTDNRMKKNGLNLIITGILFLSSCTANKILTSNTNPGEVSDMLKFETLSYVLLIEKGNKGVRNDSVSNLVKACLNEALGSLGTKIPLSPVELILTDSIDKHRFAQEVEYLCLTSEKNKSVENLSIPPTIDSLLTASGKRFGLVTVVTGFTREKGNYGKQVAKGLGMGILTMGMYYQTPIKSNSTVYAIIIDNKEKNVAFYRKSVLAEKEPTERSVLIKQINSLFETYFWETRLRL